MKPDALNGITAEGAAQLLIIIIARVASQTCRPYAMR